MSLSLGDLVMLCQKDTGKLGPRWRGPFKVFDYEPYGVSYLLVQLNGRKIRGRLQGDHLKRFAPRIGHLVGPTTSTFPTTQPIRKPCRKKDSKKPSSTT